MKASSSRSGQHPATDMPESPSSWRSCGSWESRFPSAWWLGFLIATLCWSTPVQSLAMQLAWLGRDGEVAHLAATDATTTNVNLEVSFDLEHWFHLASATPQHGVATVAHTNSEPIETWFYRAVAAPPPVRVKVGPQLDADQSVSGTVTPESGGQLTITDRAGITYQLTVRSNQVAETLVVQMTVITNFTSLPLEDRFRAAVAFEPDGFEFRGEAELRIRFPQAVPELEMVGYAFDGAGDDFHPHPWETAGNEVVLAVSHFSGTGVTAQPFALSHNYLANYNRAYDSTRSAIRLADQEMAANSRRNGERYLKKEITAKEFADRQQLIRQTRNSVVYSGAIRPLLPAAERDCGVGNLVLERLGRLMGEGASLVPGRELQRFKELAPTVRCNCAHAIIERCEASPEASGQSQERQLTDLLTLIETTTGRSDAQGCDLGNDNQLYERMDKAKCRLPWEGVVEYKRVRTSKESLRVQGESGDFDSQDVRHSELSYFGALAKLKLRSTTNAFGSTLDSWVFEVPGHFYAERDDSGREIVTGDCAVITTNTRKQGGAFRIPRPLEFYLDFLDGAFLAAELSPDNDTEDPEMMTRESRVSTVVCDCIPPKPCPKAESKTSTGSDDLLFRVLPDADSPLVTVSHVGRDLVLTYKFSDKTSLNSGPFQGVTSSSDTTEEITFTAKLRRAAR